MDRQSAAFREARPEDRVADDDIEGHAEAVHGPLTDVSEIRLPDDYETDEWDAERVGPKSLEEAREALARRIADPDAPDGPEVASAYDEIDD